MPVERVEKCILAVVLVRAVSVGDVLLSLEVNAIGSVWARFSGDAVIYTVFSKPYKSAAAYINPDVTPCRHRVNDVHCLAQADSLAIAIGTDVRMNIEFLFYLLDMAT